MANPVVVEKDMVYIYGANEYWWGGTVGEEIKYEKCCAANLKKQCDTWDSNTLSCNKFVVKI